MQGKADRFNEPQLLESRETPTEVVEVTVETNIVSSNDLTVGTLAGFMNRGATLSSPASCETRVRLTPSGPSKAGSAWYRESVPVSNGFDTYFTFQVSDHSRECTLHKDQYLSTIQHRTCNVHGGDGFAFVIQNDPNTTYALGDAGNQMGFGGIKNSLAIVFDMFSNPGEENDYLGIDHVRVQSRGHDVNTANTKGLLGLPKAYELADGKVHLVRIVYYGELLHQFMTNNLVASQSLLPYLKDNGEEKRVGLLLVFIDDGVEKNVPLLSMPINLSLLLDMPVDNAYVGFTASTGRYFQKHDILNWYWCDQEPCEKAKEADFHFHHESNFSTATLRRFASEFGSDGTVGLDGFPTHQEFPDTSAWSVPVEYFSLSNNNGLAEDATYSTPPETFYRRE